MKKLSLNKVIDASNRISKFIYHTPILHSSTLNKYLGHNLFFKAEGFQKIGAFKIRGGINSVANLVEQNKQPKLIVANSSGNHAQAVALASKIFNIHAKIFMPKGSSKVKIQATKAYGADVELLENRIITDQKVEEAAKENNVFWIHPFNHQDVICGQGTSCFEALTELENIDAVFAPCGGGGLLSGTFISAKGINPKISVIGIEPKQANDAFTSVKNGKIFRLKSPPQTIADGARTLAVGNLTFEYLQKLDDFFMAEENEIIYWTQWLSHLLKIQVEPTSAMAMVGVVKWLKNKTTKQNVLVILSGGNIDNETHSKIWSKDYLTNIPSVLN